jgi:hypothetical protein
LRTKSSDSIGSLQKVMGSVLEKRTPEQARCVECKEAFGKISGSGGTIYPVEGCDPARFVDHLLFASPERKLVLMLFPCILQLGRSIPMPRLLRRVAQEGGL